MNIIKLFRVRSVVIYQQIMRKQHNALPHTNPRSVFCASTSRSPGTWNPTGPDPGPESRPFEIGNPVHFDYARERARLEPFQIIARLVDETADTSRHEKKGRRTLGP